MMGSKKRRVRVQLNSDGLGICAHDFAGFERAERAEGPSDEPGVDGTAEIDFVGLLG